MELPRNEVFERIDLEDLLQSFPEEERARVLDKVLSHHKAVSRLGLLSELAEPVAKIVFEILRAVIQRKLMLNA